MFIAYLINIKRFLLFGLFLLSSVLLLTVSFGSSSASAASDYDDFYRTTDTLRLMSTYHDVDENITLNWQDLFMSDDGLGDDIVPRFTFGNNAATTQQIEDMRTSWLIALNGDGRWHVSNSCFFSGDNEFCDVYVSWSEDNSLSLVWGSSYLYTENYDYRLFITQNDGTQGNKGYRVFLGGSGSTVGNRVSNPPIYAQDMTNLLTYIDEDKLNYPVGYEGEPVRDSYIPPVEYDHTPNWYVSEAIDWEVQIHDTNFNTVDDLQWTCNEGLSPILYYEIWSVDDNEKIIDGYHNASAQITWQAPKVQALRTYEVKGRYFCGQEPDDPTFPYHSTRQFAISEYGMLDFTPFYQCMTDEPPYVDFEACVASFERFINQLSFGAVGYTNDWSYQSECHYLGTLGDWINVPNSSRQVCPQFSSQVRNIITPFVTFLLGLMTITFIASRGQHGTRSGDDI